jgi:hypothetical protein
MPQRPRLQRILSVDNEGRCAESITLYSAISNDAGISLKSQLEEAEAKPALEPIARRPAPL